MGKLWEDVENWWISWEDFFCLAPACSTGQVHTRSEYFRECLFCWVNWIFVFPHGLKSLPGSQASWSSPAGCGWLWPQQLWETGKYIVGIYQIFVEWIQYDLILSSSRLHQRSLYSQPCRKGFPCVSTCPKNTCYSLAKSSPTLCNPWSLGL